MATPFAASVKLQGRLPAPSNVCGGTQPSRKWPKIPLGWKQTFQKIIEKWVRGECDPPKIKSNQVKLKPGIPDWCFQLWTLVLWSINIWNPGEIQCFNCTIKLQGFSRQFT